MKNQNKKPKSKSLAQIDNIKSIEELSIYDNEIRESTRILLESKGISKHLINKNDIVNDLYLKIYDKFQANSEFKINGGYVFKTIFSLVMQTLKENKKRNDDFNFDELNDDDDNIEFDELKDSVDYQIQILKKEMDEDEFDLLMYSNIYSIKELAEMMNVKYTLLYTSIQRIKAKAKKIIENYV